MLIIGLTGSIGMGKTRAGSILRTMSIPVCDSDSLVHKIMEKDTQAISAILRLFPEAADPAGVNRQVLGQIVFKNKKALRDLEAILHPLVRKHQTKFLRISKLKSSKIAVLDVPLLYENGTNEKCDAVIVMTAPFFIQKKRVMSRLGMTEDRFRNILLHQLSDQEKRKRADFVIQTGECVHNTHTALKRVINVIRNLNPTKWGPNW